jgi:uncharacterized protein (TIGR03437 family)
MRITVLFGVLAAIAGAQQIRYTYDANGRITSANYGSRTITYTYDPAGNLLRRQIAGTAFTALSSASYQTGRPLAPEMIVAGFGEGLATALAFNTESTPPTELLGTRVEVTDSAGTVRFAPLFAVAPTQVNFLVPAGTALGTAAIRVLSGTGLVITGTAQIATTSPGLYAANQRGSGVAAAFALMLPAAAQPLLFNPNTLAPVPVNLGGADDQVYLLLFGTGMRGHAGSVTATVGGESVPVLGAVPQSQYAGLDQVNIGPLPRSLAGRGETPIIIRVDGQAANTVTVAIQ